MSPFEKAFPARYGQVRQANVAPNAARLWQLEALRGFAAFYVLLHHVSSSYLHLKHTIWGFPFRFGQEAVLIFFLLSGFVICYSHQRSAANSETFRSYLIKRARRIYPIFILALLFAYLIASWGARHWEPVNLHLLLGNIFMLQDLPERPGFFCLPFSDNLPLWSLSFEWWFYMMFYPINRWVQRPAQKFLVLTLTVVGLVINRFHPNCVCWFLVFFSIWWVGVELAHEYLATGDVSLRSQKFVFVLVGVPLVWFGAINLEWVHHGEHLTFIGYPFVELRYFFVAAVFTGLLFAWKQARYVGFEYTIGCFYRIGGISYALYLFHYPIVMHLRLWRSDRLFYVDLAVRIILVFVLAWLAEGVLQIWVNKVTFRLLSKPSLNVCECAPN